MNDGGTTKQQIVEKIKSSTNILVTVSTSPSVDELSAALGLTILLNKMNKHATAVFSGDIPPAITFLDPAKTFENTVDSLRDFIIALDKEKADHLRYKVDGDVVKIFITPYRTTIGQDDLDFSQGDYNVELVLALGVKNRDHLDQALAAHGRILHDAAVVTIGIDGPSELGTIDWTESHASSLSEMMVSVADALRTDEPLLDEQTATALLTGIVAATDRFSNDRTSSRVMTMAAQLMSAGANQQLIASKLQAAHAITGGTPENADGTTDLSEGQSSKVSKINRSKKSNKQTAKESTKEPAKQDSSQLTVSHDAKSAAADEQPRPAATAEENLAEQLASTTPVASPSVADLQKDIAQATAQVDEAAALPPVTAQPTDDGSQNPSLGGTLNATTEQAAEDKRREEASDRNRTILSHPSTYMSDSSAPTMQSPLNAANAKPDEPGDVDIFKSSGSVGLPSDSQPTASGLDFEPAPIPGSKPATLEDIDRSARGSASDALAQVDAAFAAQPFAPAGNPQQNIGAANLGQIPHDDTPPAPAALQAPSLPMPPDLSSLPPLPPIPSFDTPASPGGPTLPPENLENTLGPAPAPQATDPAQFKIPGQN